tara:strand:- start:191 stop:442 length:252 start_codon:yes stop_codon:yes gene_type:complete
MAVLRSKKYSQLDDSEILKLYAQEPVGESLHFLQIEIDQRNLETQATGVIDDNRKKARHSILYYLFYLGMFVFFLFRFGGDFI